VPQIGTTFISKRRLGDFGTPMGAKLVLELEKKGFRVLVNLMGKGQIKVFEQAIKEII
jgi:hypothetical protein